MSTTVGPIGITFHGQYVSTKEYPFLGLVTDGGSSYLHKALIPTTGNPLPVSPATETTYWVLVAKRGDSIELRVTPTAIEWKAENSTTWAPIINIADMTAARDEAVQAKNTAATSATNAATSAASAQTARTGAEEARDAAMAKVESITGMTATAVTLAPSSQATVDVKMEGKYLKLSIGVPQGIQGIPGISPTISSSKVGKITTITVVDHEGTKTFTITDGLDGNGTGNMHTNVYDQNQDGVVDKADLADRLVPTATVNQSQVVGLTAALANKQPIGNYAPLVHNHNVQQVAGLGDAMAEMLPVNEYVLFEKDWIPRDDPDDPWEQTIDVEGLPAIYNFLVTYAPGSKHPYQNANVSAVATTEDNRVTFIAVEKPSVDVGVLIEIRGVPDFDDPAVEIHNVDPVTHQNLTIDGNPVGDLSTASVTLDFHQIQEDAHKNLIVDGGRF